MRDKMKVYAWVGGDRPTDVAAAAKQKVEEGYTALKMNATPEMEWIDSFTKVEKAVERMESVRKAVGYGIGVALDFHGRVHKGMAKTLMRELEPYRPMFIEEPLLPENLDLLPEIVKNTSTPIATGKGCTRAGTSSPY